jgi:hypothetical protein
LFFVTDHSVLDPELIGELGFDPVELAKSQYIDKDSDEPDLRLIVAFLQADQVARLPEAHWRWHAVKLGTHVELLQEGYVLGRLISSQDLRVLAFGASGELELPALHERRRIAEALFSAIREARGHAVKLSAASYSLVHFELMGKGYCDLLDDLVNYTEFDSRVYDLAAALRKRLSEFLMKLHNNTVDWQNLLANAQLDFSDGVNDRDGLVFIWPVSPDRVSDLWETIELSATYNTSATGRSLSESIESTIRRLEVARDMAQALTQEAAERVSSSMNVVLYGLSIITVGFSLLAFFDKYQSADTLGLGWAQAFSTTAVASLVLCALLVGIALRHGMLLPWLTKKAKLSRLRALDSTVHGAFGHLPRLRGYRSNSVNKLWLDWFEWKLSQLIHWGLPAMEEASLMVTSESTLDHLIEIESRAEHLFYDIWMDLRLKQLHTLLDGPARRPDTTAQVDRLLARGMVRLAVDFTFLELPETCPAPQFVCALVWLQPELEYSNRAGLGYGGADALRAYFDRFSAEILGTDTPSGGRLFQRFTELTTALIRSKWDAASVDDEALWRLFEQKVLNESSVPIEWTGWYGELDFHEVLEAYEHISLSSLVADIYDAERKGGKEE